MHKGDMSSQVAGYVTEGPATVCWKLKFFLLHEKSHGFPHEHAAKRPAVTEPFVCLCRGTSAKAVCG
uniref:Uncharacterized protein n=1 Tax=Parascaris equorum TaxID=6256 RepID=A0A914RR02_PAREQ